jgi:two-component system CheB/CheR fusion protein
MATASGIQLSNSVPDQALPVLGDQARLQQVVVNLLVNAVKYTHHGGDVELSIEQSGDQVTITVTDTGAGMTDKLLKRIFDPFVQGENTIDQAQGGMGVGLTLVKSLVALHGGEITAESEGLDQGSTFSVALPLSSSVPEDSATSTTSPVDIPPLKIVIVEDNQDSRAMLQLVLEMDGHRVIAVEDGLSGLTAIEVEKPDIAFVDIGLPEMDGYEVARRLCEKGLNNQTMLVALTGFGQQRDIDLSRSSGLEMHITKPVDGHELEHALYLASQRKHEQIS